MQPRHPRKPKPLAAGSPRPIPPQPEVVPDLRIFYSSTGSGSWAQMAACNDDEYDPDWWHAEEHTSGGTYLLFALVVCADCPVRESCLRESLRTWEYRPGADTGTTRMRPSGIWGATLFTERLAARELDIDDAVRIFEDSLPGRLRIRVDKWRAVQAGRPQSRPDKVKEPRRRLLHQWNQDGTIDRIVDDLEDQEQTA